MNIDPQEQAQGSDDWRVEDVPEPEMPEDRSEIRQVPEAVAAADVTKRKDTTVETATTDEMTDAAEAAEVEQKLEAHRARYRVGAAHRSDRPQHGVTGWAGHRHGSRDVTQGPRTARGRAAEPRRPGQAAVAAFGVRARCPAPRADEGSGREVVKW